MRKEITGAGTDNEILAGYIEVLEKSTVKAVSNGIFHEEHQKTVKTFTIRATVKTRQVYFETVSTVEMMLLYIPQAESAIKREFIRLRERNINWMNELTKLDFK